ncbi:DUF799 domain-containing protein [Stenoxybacter acetivorans]|uniref:DUF799 domain-containing protein n=1 Tax=Stenoxybacter acetivorans TaxID=422441 RepID=UPI00056378DC|nr:DUF799 domain-containing protein [Stenoxybacter acetivorans]
MKRNGIGLAAMLAALLLSACAVQQEPYDYTAFKQSNPRSILVLPPMNDSPDVNASNGMLAKSVVPLAESGYYVFPIAVVKETFQQNGLSDPGDIHQISSERLNKIFGADAVLYIKVKEYGSSYQVIQSKTQVTAEATLVDGKTGQMLWQGEATASDAGQNQQQNSLIGALVNAVINQVVNNLSDKSYDVAGFTANRLLQAGGNKGLLYGPRSKMYWQNQLPAQ